MLSRRSAQGEFAHDIRPERGVVGGTEILSRRVRREVERQASESERVRFCLRGALSHSMVALEDRLLIVKPGFHAGTTFGALTTSFYYQDVTGIQVHTFLLTGWIEISSPSFQGRERKRNRQPRGADRDVYKLPNCLPISKRNMREYQHALAQLRRLIESAKRLGPEAEDTPPLVESLERISDLRRTGVLSEPEFERLKHVLLDNAAEISRFGSADVEAPAVDLSPTAEVQSPGVALIDEAR